MKKLCIYHANCTDGFGAAWAVWKKLGDTCEYVAAQYGDTPPDVIGREVIIVDFSYKKATLIAICHLATSVILLDHHKTAIEDLVFSPAEYEAFPELSRLQMILDDSHSGARLAWDFFHAPQGAPELIDYIEDRDLWRFKLDNTKAIHAFLSSITFDFEKWDSIAESLGIYPFGDSFIEQGEAILRMNQKHVESLIKNPPKIMFPEPTLQEIEIVNCPGWLASDVGHELGKRNLFGLTYFDMKDKRVFSLRSREDGIDVSEIAKRYGGGGHKHAAGFSIPLDHETFL